MGLHNWKSHFFKGNSPLLPSPLAMFAKLAISLHFGYWLSGFTFWSLLCALSIVPLTVITSSPAEMMIVCKLRWTWNETLLISAVYRVSGAKIHLVIKGAFLVPTFFLLGPYKIREFTKWSNDPIFKIWFLYSSKIWLPCKRWDL